MNIFYAPPAQINDKIIELKGQEAIHASKALRYSVGDSITVVDGIGGWYEGQVQQISAEAVRIVTRNHISDKQKQPDIILAMGIIKKRDRLEFAVEKAVELGVKEIALFRSRHTVKQNVRLDRLQARAVSAMKQSLQCWLPELRVLGSLMEVINTYSQSTLVVAHESEQQMMGALHTSGAKNTVLLVGPEGGFSKNEIALCRKKGATIISLGANRLRTETAAITLINQWNYGR